MKKILVILLTLLLISIDVYAKAGSSASRSSSSSSSSKSSSSSYGTKSYSSPATTQYSSTASKPATASSSTSSAGSSSSSSSKPSSSTTSAPVATSSTATSAPASSYQPQQSYNSGYNGGYNSNYNQGGSSGGGFFSSMAGGIGGVLIGNALFGNNNHGTSGGGGSSAPAHSGGGSTSAPGGAMVDNGATVPTSGSIAQQAPGGMSFWAILGTILYVAFEIAIVAGIIYLLWRLYKYIKTRRAMNAQNHEKNLPKFSKLFTTIQELIQSSTPDNKIKLAGLCTDEMYTYLVKIKSENGEKNLENIMSNIQVIDTTTLEYDKDENTGALYHSVKIRYKATDYWVDSNTREITEGSRDAILEDIEVWTFVSQNAGSSWKLSAIEQYVR